MLQKLSTIGMRNTKAVNWGSRAFHRCSQALKGRCFRPRRYRNQRAYGPAEGRALSELMRSPANLADSVIRFYVGSVSYCRLPAMSAAPRINRNLAEALWTFLGGRVGRRRGFARARDQKIYWSHHEKVNRHRYQEKRDRSIDKVADREVCPANVEPKVGKVRLGHDGGDQGCQQVFGESRNHSGKCRTNDHADCHVHNVTAKYELLESAEHGRPPRLKDSAVM